MLFFSVSKEALKQKGNCPRVTLENEKYLITGLKKMISLEFI